jgi:hypothetical protein
MSRGDSESAVFRRGISEASMKRVCVIDGQGGGIGATIIKALKKRYNETIEILALGTNAVATSQMLKAGANRGATGENPVILTVKTADLILGAVAVTWPNGMMGEVTPRMAEAIMSSRAPKFLVPLHQEGVVLVGGSKERLTHPVEALVEEHVTEVIKNV